MADPASRSALDLYARVEDLLGVQEAAPDLYAHYLRALQSLQFDALLDVGCGGGAFIASMQKAFPYAAFRGIDLSPHMVARARMLGVEADAIDVCDVAGHFGVITAVFDMLNYLDSDALKRFGACLRARLDPGGVFLCDVNTRYGFETVAVGSFIAEDAERFVAIDSDVDGNVYQADFTLFSRDDAGWQRSDATIRQHYHTPEGLADALGMEAIEAVPVMLYAAEEPDKIFYRFRLG